MRILKLSAYCYPEQESSTHLTDDQYEAYEKAGFYVDNYVPMPTRGVSDEIREKYKKIKTEQQYNGHVTIHRFPMFREGRNPIGRAIRYVLVNMIQYWKGTHAKDIDIVFSGSTPPTQGLLCTLVKKRLAKKNRRQVSLIYAIQDVFPDSLVSSGLTHKGSILWKIGNKMSNYVYRNADRIITISDSLKKNLEDKGVPGDKIRVISNWIDTEGVVPVNKSENPLFDEFSIERDKFIVVYAGNMGASQGVTVIPKAARILEKEEDILFVLFGEGAEKDKVIQESEGLKNIAIHGLLPIERVSEVYSLGDISLITCKKGVGSSGMPSKTWSIMACNTPIVASFDMDSDLAETLSKANAGTCVPPEDPEALANEIYNAYIKLKKTNGKTVDTRTYVINHADKKACTQCYVDTIRNCQNDFGEKKQ